MKKRLIVLLVSIICIKAFADNTEIAISLPSKTVSGDFISIVFSSSKAMTNVEYALAHLYQPNGKKAVSVKAFYTDESKKTMVALLGISIFWNSGKWIIEGEIKTDGCVTSKRNILLLVKKSFPKDTIKMGKRNTTIVKDNGKKKKRQIASFASLVNRQNFKAKVYAAPMILPVKSKRRTGGFADARIYKYADGSSASSYHWGVDFGVPIGTAIFASGSGQVIFSGKRITTGYTVAIEHAPGVVSMYFHLSKLLVQSGKVVKAGDTIGLSGSTGFSTGPHLHWELRINGRRVSPDALCKKPLF